MAGVIADFPMVDNLIEIDEATTGVEAIEQSIYFSIVSRWGLPRRRHDSCLRPACVAIDGEGRYVPLSEGTREVGGRTVVTKLCLLRCFFVPPFLIDGYTANLGELLPPQCNRGMSNKYKYVRENEGDDDTRVGVCRMANSKEGESWSEDFLVGDSNPLLPHMDGCVYLL